MRQLFIALTILTMTTTTFKTAHAQQPDFSKAKAFEQQLDDVMELTDTTELKRKLKEVEESYRIDPNELTKVRLGIIYHETALNLSFLSKTEYKGYAKKSYDTLTELYNASNTTNELKPFIASYRASALSLVGAETKKLSYLGEAFQLFDTAITKYQHISYLPEFLRGSVAENLPWIFVFKKKYAKKDFQSIIAKHDNNINYANWKIMSFTYWAWAKQHQQKKYRKQAIEYLNSAIELDPNFKAARQRSEELKMKLLK